MAFNNSAKEFFPTWCKLSSPQALQPKAPPPPPPPPPARLKYSAAELRDVQRRMQHSPGDVRHAKILERVSHAAPDILGDDARAAAFVDYPPPCPQCVGECAPADPAAGAFHSSAWTEPSCGMVAGIVDSVVAEERVRHGAFLLQSPAVVFGTVQHLALFSGRGSAPRGRVARLAGLPDVVARIKAFLCGGGFHYPAPRPDQDDLWRGLGERLRFDWIRDSRTPIFTELSRQWKRRSAPFEQFGHFLFYRDDMPLHPSRNMLTHAQKPVIVACLAGDTSAVVLLCKLGFAVPPDVFWDGLPFFQDMLDRKRFMVLRHLCAFFYRRQFQNPAPAARVLATERPRMTRTPRLTPRAAPMQPPPPAVPPPPPAARLADLLRSAPSLPAAVAVAGVPRKGAASASPVAALPPPPPPALGKRWASIVAAKA